MKQFFTALFEYSHYYNQQVFDVIKNNPEKVSEKVVKLINHVVNAHHIWNYRIEKTKPIIGVWELHTIAELKTMNQENFQHTLQILNKADLCEVIQYTNSKGEVFSNSIRDILFHVVNHFTYHRGQIVTDLKNQGVEPLVSDYIFYKRQK
ncbi:MAG: damage-inducible protein DinB [Bacteroidia bacterium]|nr:damage-inducible protein DinB [Bacteroidia bacterium]